MDLNEQELLALQTAWADPKFREALKKLVFISVSTSGADMSVVELNRAYTIMDDHLDNDTEKRQSDDPV